MKSTLIPALENRIPEFARESYPRFVQYITDYLSWLEQDNNFLSIINDWRHNMEPSNDVEPYVTAILTDLGFTSEQNLTVPKSTMIHLIRDFYLSRGTEASFRFLFRALFNSDVSIRYPREDLLIPSYATYGTRHFIYTSAANRNTRAAIDLFNYVKQYGGTLVGVTSETEAAVEDITIVYGAGIPYLQIEIVEPLTQFDVGEQVLIRGETQIFEAVMPVLTIKVQNAGSGYSVGDQVYPVGASMPGRATVTSVVAGGVTGIQIVSGGSGYKVGDRINASSMDNGFGFSAAVKAVDANGAITEVRISSKGYNYETLPIITTNSGTTPAVLQAVSAEIGAINRITISDPFVDFSTVDFSVLSDFGTGAVLEAEAVSRWSTSEWLARRGFIGESSTLIDSYKYQQFSYTIVSPIASSQYDSFVKEFLHPVGYVRTSSYEIVAHGTLGLSANGDAGKSSISLIYDTEYDLKLSAKSSVDTNELDYLVTGDGEIIVTGSDDPILFRT